jgi:predicted metal-dependent peptidase
MDSAQQALNKAKIQLMTKPDSTFFTTVCFSLKHIWDDTIPTAATNGEYIKFNPQFFMALSPEERVFLLLHESMHVAFLHMDRLKTRDRAKWNVAADHVINLMLLDRGFKMPKDGLADSAYIGLSTEEVYKILPDQDESKVMMDLQDPEVSEGEFQQSIEDILIRASVQAKMNGDSIGSIPVDIQLFLNGLLAPKLPWNRILQKYIQALSKHDYSFRKPYRRYFPQFHLPSLHSETLMDIAVAVDISGSVTDLEFKSFVSEINSIFKMMKPEKISLIQFDTVIKSVDVLKNTHDLSQVEFRGRGGTRIEPVIQWANENKPQLLLVFTDGEFRFRGLTTKANTVWLIHNNERFQAPFGKVINYKM